MSEEKVLKAQEMTQEEKTGILNKMQEGHYILNPDATISIPTKMYQMMLDIIARAADKEIQPKVLESPKVENGQPTGEFYLTRVNMYSPLGHDIKNIMGVAQDIAINAYLAGELIQANQEEEELLN